MLKVYNYITSFQEIPDEINLMLMISGCKNNCPGCHSPWLKEDIGEPLEELLPGLVEERKNLGFITTVLFMGGEHNQPELIEAMKYCKLSGLKTGWYSGLDEVPTEKMKAVCDYIKIGSYKAEFGGLDKETTNQILYEIKDMEMTDVTHRFWRKKE